MYIEVLSQSLGDCSQNKNQKVFFYPEDLFSSIGRIWHEHLQEIWVNSMIFMYSYFKAKLSCQGGFLFSSFKLSEGDFEGEMLDIQDEKKNLTALDQ